MTDATIEVTTTDPATEVEGTDVTNTICAMLSSSSAGTISRDIQFSFELVPGSAGQ